MKAFVILFCKIECWLKLKRLKVFSLLDRSACSQETLIQNFLGSGENVKTLKKKSSPNWIETTLPKLKENVVQGKKTHSITLFLMLYIKATMDSS